MDLRRLEIFLKIYETGSLSKAAKALGLSQPSVSTSLKTLEDSLGHKLFVRTPRSVKALQQAHILAPYAKDILEATSKAMWAMSHNQGGPRQTVIIGASSVPGTALLPAALAEFHKKYPQTLIKIKSGESASIIAKMLDGEIDLALVGMRAASVELVQQVVAKEDLMLLARKDLVAQMGQAPKNLENLCRWPLIMREDGSGTKSTFMKVLSNKPELIASLKIVAEVEGLNSAIALAKSGLGATVISGLSVNQQDLNGMELMPLPFLPTRKFYMIRRKSPAADPATKALWELIEDGINAYK